VSQSTNLNYRIEVSDFNSNKTTITIPIEFSNEEATDTLKVKKTKFFIKSDKEYNFEKGNWSFYIPKGTFYDDFYLNFEQNDNSLLLENDNIPVHTNFLISVIDTISSKEDKEKIEEAIALTDISHLIEKKHDEISDGQLQIALITRSLSQNTSIIALDEPTTHLDLVHKATLLKLLQKLAHETGKTILYSTHDIDLAIQMADEMIVITSNKILQDQPWNLIQTGIFNSLFDSKHLTFDATIGKFKIQ
jgi:ABC-type dipeptide/oligopeptide/nickel transport system ATPase subunit